MCPQETADLVTFTEVIRNGKLHFLCSVMRLSDLRSSQTSIISFWIFLVWIIKFRKSCSQKLLKIGVVNGWRNCWQFSQKVYTRCLTLSWRRSLSYRNQSIHFQIKSMDWLLYDRDLRHERVACVLNRALKTLFTKWNKSLKNMLTNNRPNIEPLRTPDMIYAILWKSCLHSPSAFHLRDKSTEIWGLCSKMQY